MLILGISAFYHDSAAALVRDGEIIAAAQEERFTRRKHDSRFPVNAIHYCLGEAKARLSDLDAVAFYDKPFLKFERLFETYLSFAPRGFASFRMAMPVWLQEKLFQKHMLHKALRKIDPGFEPRTLLFAEHHLSHAASAFFPSPFEEAAILTMDGVGEWATTSMAIGRGARIEIEREIHFPHSLGLLYAAFTYYAGFKVNSGEYKLMGLAPYGEPRFASLIYDHLIDLKQDGTFRLDQSYFNYCTGLTMTNSRFDRLFGQPPRQPEQLLTQFHMDIAASIQAVTEEVVLRLGRSIAKETGLRDICLAGGVALNCVANGKLHRSRIFDRIWIQPASGDAGGSIGAALAAYHIHRSQPRHSDPKQRDKMAGSYLGPAFSRADIIDELKRAGARFSMHDTSEVIDETAAALADGLAVAWVQGRMEFGPRALGARSILGDPLSPSMQRLLNMKVKYRESFRPFAPSVLREDVAAWFEMDDDSPYMLLVADIVPRRRRQLTAEQAQLFGIDKLNVPRSDIPAVTHVDYSARVQTVHEDTNPLFYRLLRRFKELTGCPVLVNTSFNVRGEPIVCTPTDAFRCFMGTELDMLVVGDAVLRKEEQGAGLKRDYKEAFELD